MSTTSFGYLVRQARQAKGLTLTAVARHISTPKAHLSRIELGASAPGASAALVARLLLVLEIPPTALPTYLSALAHAREEIAAAETQVA